MKMDDITDRNIEQLEFTGKALGRAGYGMPRAANLGLGSMERSQPGSRPDGGMAVPPPELPSQKETQGWLDQIAQTENRLRAQLVDARNIIDNFERDMAMLESEVNRLDSELRQSQMLKDHFEGMLRKIAELVVNGSKDKPA